MFTVVRSLGCTGAFFVIPFVYLLLVFDRSYIPSYEKDNLLGQYLHRRLWYTSMLPLCLNHTRYGMSYRNLWSRTMFWKAAYAAEHLSAIFSPLFHGWFLVHAHMSCTKSWHNIIGVYCECDIVSWSTYPTVSAIVWATPPEGNDYYTNPWLQLLKCFCLGNFYDLSSEVFSTVPNVVSMENIWVFLFWKSSYLNVLVCCESNNVQTPCC